MELKGQRGSRLSSSPGRPRGASIHSQFLKVTPNLDLKGQGDPDSVVHRAGPGLHSFIRNFLKVPRIWNCRVKGIQDTYLDGPGLTSRDDASYIFWIQAAYVSYLNEN